MTFESQRRQKNTTRTDRRYPWLGATGSPVTSHCTSHIWLLPTKFICIALRNGEVEGIHANTKTSRVGAAMKNKRKNRGRVVAEESRNKQRPPEKQSKQTPPPPDPQSAFSSLLSHRRPIKHPTRWLLSCRRRCWPTWWPSPMPLPRPSAAPAVSGDGQSQGWPAPEGETGTGDGGDSGCLRWQQSPAARRGAPPKITTPFLEL
jgi:hypothetical protein